jgi:hypothetical protein
LLLASQAKAKGNAKAKGKQRQKMQKGEQARVTTFARSLTKAREATFAFDYATQRQKERQPLLLAKAGRLGQAVQQLAE